jgi:hypothetical protein
VVENNRRIQLRYFSDLILLTSFHHVNSVVSISIYLFPLSKERNFLFTQEMALSRTEELPRVLSTSKLRISVQRLENNIAINRQLLFCINSFEDAMPISVGAVSNHWLSV